MLAVIIVFSVFNERLPLSLGAAWDHAPAAPTSLEALDFVTVTTRRRLAKKTLEQLAEEGCGVVVCLQ
jgi:hypothetical protein